MTKRMKTGHMLGKLATALLIVISLASCGSPEKIVKKGRIKLDESITIGQAFNNYQFFKKTKWKTFKDDQGRKIVEITGTLDMNETFISDYNGQTLNMLQGQFFEEGLLDLLLEQNTASENDVQAIMDVARERLALRNTSTAELVGIYESNPEKYTKVAVDHLAIYQHESNKEHLQELMDNYFLKINRNINDSFDYKLEILRDDYRDSPERFTGLIDDNDIKYLKLKDKYRFDFVKIDERCAPIIRLYAEGKSEEGLKTYEEIAGYLTTKLKGNSGTYTCQFAIEGKGFKYFGGELSLTLDIDEVEKPVTFTLPESRDTIYYLRAIYGNKRIIE